jgi:hypothetical protein
MRISSTVAPTNTTLTEYKSRVHSLQAQIAAVRARRLRAFVPILSIAALSMPLLTAVLNGAGLHLAYLAIALILVACRLRIFLRARIKMIDLARRSSFYERGIERLEGRWRGTGKSGTEFERERHLYQSDLDVLGEGSLFELLSTTRSEAGAERLAAFLLDPVSIDEARARQEAVKELRDAASLREEVAVLGDYQFQNCRGESFREWFGAPILKAPRIVPVFLLFSGLSALLLGLCGYGGIFLWIQIAPLLIPLLVAQACIGLWLMRQVRIRLKMLPAIGSSVTILRRGVELIGQQQFHSAKLRSLVESLCRRNAATRIRKLERLLTALERREDMLLYAFLLWLAAGTQLILAAERWRAAHQTDFEAWLDAWAEFDALNALGGYAWEHPDYVFPELLDCGALFEAEDLCHPLLPAGSGVANDVALNSSTKFYVVSGSNMAGKSTLLRAIGLSAVLASAGAPIRASRARMAVFQVCASLSIKDSLMESKSRFLAEVERLRDSIHVLEAGQPVLFLIDEILGGTNSKDRRIAAEALIRRFVAGDAVGALSTHDLALTEIGAAVELRGANVHMESENPDEPLAFDYRLKPGVSRQTNALSIVRMMGIEI